VTKHSSPVLDRVEQTPAHPLTPVFRPRSIAVVGASWDPTKRGYQVVRGLLARGFTGAVYPVNPRGGELLGLPVFADVRDLPMGVDLAVVCTPAQTVPDVIDACGERRVAGALVLAVGFRETGPAGAQLEARLAEASRRTGVRVVGPNTSGIMNLSVGLDLLGLDGVPSGRIALLAQSGNIALDLFVEATASAGEGFSLYVGMGNQTDLGLPDILDYLGHDPDTQVILVHSENLQRGREFLDVARRVAARKPIIFLKGGRTEAGEESARSHTGAVATDLQLLRTGLTQAGVLEATRTDEWLSMARNLVGRRLPLSGEGIAVLSDGGGQATLAADALSERGVPLAPLSLRVQERLRELLGLAAAVSNPVDVAGAGDRDPEIFAAALRLLLEEKTVACVLHLGLFGGYALRFSPTLAEVEVSAAREIGALAQQLGKPLVLQSIYADSGAEPFQVLAAHGIHAHRSLEVACASAAAIWAASASANRASRDLPHPVMATPPAESGHPALLQSIAEGRTVLLEVEVRDLLGQDERIPLMEARLARTAQEAAVLAETIGGRLALRVVSRAFPHKTEVGGVVLGVSGGDEAAKVFDVILASVDAAAQIRGVEPGVEGVLLSPLLPNPTAELLVGVRRDPSFGLVLTVGAGGTLVEVWKDVALRLFPVTDGDVREMLAELRISPLLKGYRGQPGIDEHALEALILGLADMAMRHPELAEIELNPVFAYPDRVVALDARGFLQSP